MLDLKLNVITLLNQLHHAAKGILCDAMKGHDWFGSPSFHPIYTE